MNALALVCPDWWEKLQRNELPVPFLDLDAANANMAEQVFGKLRLPDVFGLPALKDAAADWIKGVVRHIFGTVTDAVRWVREFFLLVPKKNSKTTNGAAIMLTALILNERPRGEFLLVGPTQEIADTGFSQAVGMIEADPSGYLQKRFKIRDHIKTIEDRQTRAKLKIKTFDNKVMTGAKPVAVLLDEVHILGKFSFAAKVIRQIRGGIIANPEGFFMMITTQSDDPPTGAFKTELEYARDIRDGKVKGDMLPFLYEFPLELQADNNNDSPAWQDPKLWPCVLPNLGKSIQLDLLVSEFEKAKAKGTEELSIWASQHLNVQIGIALSKDGWAGARYWNGAADETISLETIMERCDVAVMGVDGGGLDDLLGVSVCGRSKTTKEWLFWFKAWAQTDVLEQRKQIADALHGFEEDGDLVICPDDDPTRDVREVAEIAKVLNEAGLLPERHAIGLDAAGVAAIVDALSDAGIADEQMSAIPQGYKLNGAVLGMERKLKDGTLWHDGSPLMVWCVGNAKTEQRGNAVLITKQAAGRAKIDPLAAGFNATELMSRNPEGQGGPSVYESRGLRMVG